jgi:DNA (cytosine-5)-methyltransferase 1
MGVPVEEPEPDRTEAANSLGRIGRMMFCAAEFFAGIGLVRLGLEREGIKVVFANDIDPQKRSLYAMNFGPSRFVLKDIKLVQDRDVPNIDLATASFPCIDLSLAGNRAGLRGKHSNTFWEFARVLEEMLERRPRVVLIENVVGFQSAHNGRDLASAARRLNSLGYSCGVVVIDARFFVPQSRPRLFIVGSLGGIVSDLQLPDSAEGEWVRNLRAQNPDIDICELSLPPPRARTATLADIVEHFTPDDPIWWDMPRVRSFRDSLRPIHAKRLDQMRRSANPVWATAYRRTRDGDPVWEIRVDGISGCLRTARGGSSKQAMIEADGKDIRVRWMTPREYARLQGAPEYKLDGVRRNIGLSAFGDAVCVPVISWIAKHCLIPLLKGDGAKGSRQLSLAV